MAAPVTDLAQQLAQRAVRHGVDQGKRHPGKASLLYTFQEAADIDAETIYRIGVEGLDQLCSLDGRFQAYRRTLFGQASLALDRDAATADVNAKLDAAIAGFCTLLSSYFLLAPAFKALEFLVRKYKVHERNVEELMLAALPFHETEQFVRLVQILRLPPRGRFAFLEPMQASGAPAPRDVIVLRCVTDRSLLRFVCDMAQRQADPRLAGRVALPFYAVLVCELLAKLKGVDEPLLTMLLPYLLAGLSESAVADYRAATYMIIGQLASRATFTADLATALVTEACRTASAGLLSSVVMLLAHLANTQEHLAELPEKAFKHLAKVSGLVDQLAALSEKGCRIGRLLGLLARAAMAQLPARPHYEQLLQALLARVQMGDAARTLAAAVLQQAGGVGEEEAHRQVLQRLLRALDLRYPAAVDAAVDAALPQGRGGAAGSGADEQQRQQRVLALLSAAFEGTARSPLLEAGTTVLLAAEAPAVAVRQLAVQRLDAIVAASAGSEAAAAAGAALLGRLQDDSPSVVQAVLGCASLLQLPQAALADGLAACFDSAIRQAGERGVKKAQRAEARGVARKALKLMAGPVLSGSPQLLPRVLPLVLAALLVGPACGRKVVATAVKAARGLGSALLAGLEGVQLPQEGAEGQREEAAVRGGSGKKGTKKAAAEAAQEAAAAAERRKAAADAAYNARVVAALGAQAASSPAAAAELCQALASSSSGEPGAAYAQPLLLLTTHAAVHADGNGAAAVAASLLRQLRGPPGAFQPTEALQNECFDANGVPTPAFLARGAPDSGALQSGALLAALRRAPWPTLAPRGSTDALGLLRTLCTLRWQPALSALLARLAEQQVDPLGLLSELFAAPPSAEAAAVQLESVQQATALLHDRLAAGRPGSAGGRKQGSGGGVSVGMLGRALCVLCHPDRKLRQAGVSLAHACAQLLQSEELSARTQKQLASALAEHAELLAADADGLQRLIEAVLGVGEGPAAALAGCALPPADAASLAAALLAAAEEQAGVAAAAGRNAAAAAAAAHAARLLLGLAAERVPPAQLLSAASRLASSGTRIRAALPAGPEAEPREALLAASAGCFTAPRLEALARQPAGGEAAAALDAWCRLLELTGPLPAGARVAVLSEVQERFFSLLPADVQGRCLKALLRGASTDSDEACRSAARAALATMPLPAATLLPLLTLEPSTAAVGAEQDMRDAEPAGEAADDQDEELARLQAEAEAAAAAAAAAKQGTPRSKQKRAGKPSKEAATAEAAAVAAADAVERRRQQLAEQRQARQQGRAAADGGHDAAGARAVPAGECCTAVLELLQWKENVHDRLQLVPAVQAVLSQLLTALAGEQGEEGVDGEQAPLPALAGMAANEAMYVVQLCLAALAGMARSARRGAPPTPAQAPALPTPAGKAKGKGRRKDAATAAAADRQHEALHGFDLGLAVRAAQQAPDGAARNAALELVAELALGMPEAALAHVLEVVAVVGASAALQEDEQSERVASQALRAILPAWIDAGKGVQELVAAVVAALPRVSRHRRLPLLAALVSALPQVEGLCSVLCLLLDQGVAQQVQAAASAAAGEAAMSEADTLLAAGDAAEEEPAWQLDLAGDLLAQAAVLVQVQVSAALLERSLAASQQQPWQALPLLAVAFVTQHLEQRGRAASAAAAAELAAAYQQLMQQCLLHLQRLGERQVAQRRGSGTVRTGTAGCYRLLRALRQHMPTADFLAALVALAGSSPADRVRRKALHLLAGVVRDAAADAVWQQQQQPEAAAAAAEAALAVCQPAQQLLETSEGAPPAEGAEPVAPLTRQVALAAVGAVAAAHGAQHPERLLGILPSVLAAAGSGQAAVRGSALAAAAALAAALGPRLVPLLPKTVAAVIGAVKSAAAAVTEASSGRAQPRRDGSGSEGSGSEGSGSEGGDSDEGGAARGRAAPPTEAAALELGAALAAVAALVEHLGAFLAPHLPLLLGVLLHPAVLQCSAAHCSDSAAAIRQQLAERVPTRLLLPPLLAHLDPATEAGADSTCGLLRMLRSAVDAMDASALASHHEAVFGALLRALDLRRRRPAALLAASGGLDRVEGAAVACFVGLVMRLTEPRFKPLFFRLLEWAHAVPAGDSDLPTGTGQLLRSVALFSLVNALAEALRSVFVPYYGLLLDACVAHLSDGSVAAGGKKGKKKKRKSGEAGGDEGGAPTRDELYVEHDWRLRLKVVRALHRCFLYDTGAAGAPRFLDEARFQRLLPPLVAHLGLQPPPAVAAALEADGAADGAAGLEASLQLGAGGGEDAPSDGGPDSAAALDPLGRAVVAALAQLGVTAGSDALWKPLNHQVLMMTRSLEPRTRLLALETVAQLAGRLSEEYLALLPETLPFLSELLEDAELAVEAAAARLVKQLEALSGESLAQYLS